MIRKATPDDLPDIIKVLNTFNFQLLPQTSDSLIDNNFSDSLVLANQITILNWENGFVAELNNHVVGFCHYKPFNDVTVKTTIMTVFPTYRRHGIGSQLHLTRMKQAYNQGFSKMITFSENPEAIAWYQKHFDCKIGLKEPIRHRLYMFPSTTPVYGIHYGFSNYETQTQLICDLKKYFKNNPL